MMRTFDARLVDEAIMFFMNEKNKYDAIKWISDPKNIALSNDAGDLAVFEYDKPGVVIGHYYFQSRGRDALKAATNFLDEVFNPCYNIQVIRGLTPLTNLGARWMSKKLGFTSYGLCSTISQTFELFILTATEYRSQHKKEYAA